MEENKLEYCEIRLKTPLDLIGASTEQDDEGYFIDGQWYLKEMEPFIPSNRTITVLKEFDYYVFQSSNKEEYRIQAGMVDEVLANVSKPAWWSSDPVYGNTSPATPPPEPQPAINHFEGAVTVYKKKPRAKNKFPIEVGDLCLVNGLIIPQTVTGVINDGNTYKIEVAGATTQLKSEDVFPLYELDLTKLDRKLELGDVVSVNTYGYVLMTSADFITNALTVGFTRVYRHTDPNNNLIPRKIFKQYKGGEITDSTGKKISSEELKKAESNRFKPTIEVIQSDFEIELIAKHYGISPADVKPKEVQVLKALEVLLDHPECVAQKEWALIVGPSGSGKTTVAVEYAESKGLDYIIQGGSAQLTVDDLLGYNSITTGDYFPSLLRGAIEEGKVFILDEIDACNPNTLLCLNAFKRDKVQFPDALIEVHPEFRFLATANTLMYSEDYNGRSAMDRATIKRFSTLFYDLTKAELAVRYGFEETKGLTDKMTDKKAYSSSEYELIHGCILQPKGDLDPRDIQRMVRMNKLKKEGAFK